LRNAATLAIPATLVLASLFYAPVLVELARDWLRDPNYSHGFLIPVISGFLVWQRRRALAALPPRPTLWGLVGVLAAAGLLVLGAAGAEVFTQRVSWVLLLASVVLFLAGWPWLRKTAFPIGFLLFAVPMPYVLYYSLTGPMQGFAARCAIAGLRGVGVPAVAQGNIIHLPETSLEVAEACSGIRSLYAFLALGALLARSLPIPWWGRALVFLATIPLSVAGNAVRVWGTGIGTYTIGPSAAEGTLHELFGLIIFGSALGVLVLVRKGARVLWSSAP
jgi:exosortase